MFSFGVQLFYFKKKTDLVNTLGDEQGPKKKKQSRWNFRQEEMLIPGIMQKVTWAKYIGNKMKKKRMTIIIPRDGIYFPFSLLEINLMLLELENTTVNKYF